MQSKGLQGYGRRAAVAKNAGAGGASVTCGLLPLHGADVAGEHLLVSPFIGLSDTCNCDHREVAGASNAVASRRETLGREAHVTCLSRVGCACLTDGRYAGHPVSRSARPGLLWSTRAGCLGWDGERTQHPSDRFTQQTPRRLFRLDHVTRSLLPSASTASRRAIRENLFASPARRNSFIATLRTSRGD